MYSTQRSANSYWLTLAACYGLTIGAATTIAMPWLLIVACVFIAFPLIVGFFYGQIGSRARRDKVRESPVITIAATAFSAIALLLRDSPVVGWAGPVLGAASFAGMYLCLRRYGHFHMPAGRISRNQEGMKLGDR
ncbi:hypothetical protein [Paenarthrobacter sp. JL.01a]|uniref:hypothetical protein n=1 Tax=Paenarthrobacter sp. JL.01a TaxID=2979324 RepID=UPI0021C76C81|nr:hypothetical protein [Paenarthrobacter sp. JL.01a]UXM91099.1 hypothetical protein N5P29_17650 [Paenarthrobacter sp. JL.01a]